MITQTLIFPRITKLSFISFLFEGRVRGQGLDNRIGGQGREPTAGSRKKDEGRINLINLFICVFSSS